MLYFYLKKRTFKLIKMVLPHQTHLGTENTLFLPKKHKIKLITQFSSVHISLVVQLDHCENR